MSSRESGVGTSVGVGVNVGTSVGVDVGGGVLVGEEEVGEGVASWHPRACKDSTSAIVVTANSVRRCVIAFTSSYNMFVKVWYPRDTDCAPNAVRWAVLSLRVAP